MNHTLTLICNPAQHTIDLNTVGVVRDALNDLGGETAPADWLADGEACDIAFSGLANAQAESCAMHALDGLPLDVVAQDSENRQKKLLIADMDSTIVAEETLDELADFAGIKDQIAAITARAMNGEVAFRDALHERVALLKGLTADALAQALARTTLNPGALALVRTMRANKAFTALISGGFTYFTDHIRDRVGFDVARGNVLGIEDGVLTGTVEDPIVTKDVKRASLLEFSGQKHIALTQTLAIGDGANDLPMLQAAGLGVAYHAKAVAREGASARIDHGDLTAALYAQGYRKEDFVTD